MLNHSGALSNNIGSQSDHTIIIQIYILNSIITLLHASMIHWADLAD